MRGEFVEEVHIREPTGLSQCEFALVRQFKKKAANLVVRRLVKLRMCESYWGFL